MIRRLVLCLVALTGCKTLLGIEEPSDQLRDASLADTVADVTEPVDTTPDPDGDGVRENDNCPDDANADQNDEDADGLGDPCDRCPISTNNVDGDADGVGDDCDPRPNQGGDAFVAFWGFRTAPATPGILIMGDWSYTDGTGVVTGSQNMVASMTVPAPNAQTTITTRVIIDEIFGTNTTRSAGTVTHFDSASGRGVVCAPGINAANTQGVFVVDTQTSQTMFDAHAVTAGLEMVVSGGRSDDHFECRRTGSPTLAIDDPYIVAASRLGARARSMSARFFYVMIVRS